MDATFSQTPLPYFFISRSSTMARVRNFQEHKHPQLSSELSIRLDKENCKETKAIWYPIEHIELLLKEMKMLNADGLRIYFGAYPYNEASPSAGQLCLLMVPTRPMPDASADDHEDIILEEQSGFAERVKLSEDNPQLPGINTSSANGAPSDNDELVKFFIPPGSDTIDLVDKAFNQGFPCPPKCSRGMKYGLDEENGI